jgi:DNA-directed RNA polymerase subunit M/transcription elongation factor TFIIS
MDETLQRQRCVRKLLRANWCEALTRAIDKFEDMQDLLNEFGTKHADKIAKYMRRGVDSYAALDSYVATQFEHGCIKYASAMCSENGIAARDFGPDSIFTGYYSDAVYKIVDLLRDAECEFVRAIVCEKVAVDESARVNVLQFCPSIMSDSRKEVALRRGQKIERSTSTAYQCKKCGKRSVTLEEHQMRRPDEPPALVIQCTECLHTWIM